MGQAAQVQTLDLIAQIREAERASASASLSVKELATKAEDKAARAERRRVTLANVTNLAEKVKRAREDEAAPAPAPVPAPAALPTFEACACNEAPPPLREQLEALEAANMAGYTRNGDPFSEYWSRSDLTLHVARRGADLLGFAICGADSQRVQFLYELHTAAAARKTGVARHLLSLVELPRGSKKPKIVRLNVHATNTDAHKFYLHMAFAWVSQRGLAWVMQRN